VLTVCLLTLLVVKKLKSYKSEGRMKKPLRLSIVCVAQSYALAVLYPVASVALLITLCSQPRLSSRL